MTVHERGYRRYEGGFSTRTPAWTIFREGYRVASRGKGFRILGILVLIIFVIQVAILFVQLNINEVIASTQVGGEAFQFGTKSAEFLTSRLVWFYGFASLAAVIMVILNGAGLVSDDVRTRGLSLYLVRPIRPMDYVVGKSAILPALLILYVLVPGILLFLLAGLWQPDGTTGAWMAANSIFATTALRYWAASAAGYTGIMLILSSISQRRGWIRVFAVAVFFGVGIFVGIANVSRVAGSEVFRYLSVGGNADASLNELTLSYLGADEFPFDVDLLPDPNIGLLVNLLVMAIGMAIVWRRARSVEVSA